jgi:hypothetical protein
MESARRCTEEADRQKRIGAAPQAHSHQGFAEVTDRLRQVLSVVSKPFAPLFPKTGKPLFHLEKTVFTALGASLD